MFPTCTSHTEVKLVQSLSEVCSFVERPAVGAMMISLG